jgi:membrane-bound inhibitor of C-type lysozyme
MTAAWSGRPALAALAACAALGSAHAGETLYRCPADKTEFTAVFTPDRAHVKLNEQQWTLARVRAAGAARYVNGKQGVTLVTQRREAVLTIGPRELRCEFTIKP